MAIGASLCHASSLRVFSRPTVRWLKTDRSAFSVAFCRFSVSAAKPFSRLRSRRNRFFVVSVTQRDSTARRPLRNFRTGDSK
ncbi:hypothetical protein [Reyranella sp. CPCC 100927]|uniref:hypothetical protein n=1 Tax=Reyranella sp. CPCC 100927 TaxID=2599616 RepID=UPI0011B6D601|nr:hypothetical protein [Reyranella sp. CPCC 100927]TWT11443.1 hypothetical protein FQU96_13215 [Reyranella sp. CPCC 100927]